MSRRIILYFIATILLIAGVVRSSQAQQQQPPPAPTPTPKPNTREEQEPVKVFTEEVRLPVVAYDDYGRFDPDVSLNDILVLEDGEPQEIRSVRRIPSNILLLLDTSGAVTLGKDIKTTRAVALRLLGKLRPGDQVSVMQFSDRPELLQDWTTDTEAVTRVLKTKLSGAKRERLSEAIVAAVAQLKDRPAGSRHIVLITDGVETPGGRITYEEAIRQLSGAQATVHIISYSTAVRLAIEERNRRGVFQGGAGSQREALPVPDPTMPPGQTRNPSVTFGTIDLDREMRRRYKRYADEMRRSEERLVKLADETGGRILLSTTSDQMIRQADEVARDIGAQYIVTYTPKRPLASARSGEYRRVEVASRRVGLGLRSRRGYTVTPTP
ncbi:MAG: VWA domain-containing protein [Acidobacteria bacterium]|nr:VWA domain-containing protein [Acidobacteriota bacterium]